MGRYKDFDAFFAEKRQAVEPVTFTLGGETYTLPGRLPAEVGLLALSLSQNEGAEAEVTAEGVRQMLACLLGEKQYTQLLATDIDITELTELFTWILGEYEGGINAAEEQPGNPAAPAGPGPKPESSKAGA